MKFSIIVAAYNVADYLEECVESLANQNFPNAEYEVLIVDDGSTDCRTGLVCDQLTSKFEVVRTIHQENGGLSSARNTGIKYSKGDYLLFVDGDDFWNNPEFLDKLSKNIEKFRSDVIVFSYNKYYGLDDSVKVSFDFVPDNGDTKENIIGLVKNEILTAPAWNKCVKKDLFEQGLDFPIGFLSEDCLYCAKLLKMMSTYSILNIDCYQYRQNRRGSITNVVKEKNVIDILKSIEIGLIDVNSLELDVKHALNIYFAISYISILPFVNQYYSHPEIQRLLKKYRFLLKFSNEIKNRSFKYTGMMTRLFGTRLSIKMLANLLKFYKKL